jgi:ketosteroid isomerase-like protein
MSAMSRRKMFNAGACALAGTELLTAVASADVSDSGASNEAVIRKWYKLWERKDKNWSPFGALLADDFTFTSPVDDHISKATFKTNCWETQINFLKRFDLELVSVKGNEALVKYLCHTMNGRSFRNVEYHRLRNQRIAAIECYFGGKLTYPSAVSLQKS